MEEPGLEIEEDLSAENEPEDELFEPEPEDFPIPPQAALREPNPENLRPLEPGETPDLAPSQPTSTIEMPTVEPRVEPRNETPEARRRRMWALLNPSRVASGSYTVTGPGPIVRGPPAGLGDGGDTGPSEQDIERRHSQFLRSHAMTKTHTQTSRPEVRRQPDGSYAYTGHRFTARIRTDGTVDWEDSPNVQTNGFSASGSMDITEAFMSAAGQDPHRAEREWFLRHTEELRHRLEAEHRQGQMASGLRRLRGRLVRTWAATNRSAQQRRRRIFDIWDDIAEDGDGERGRAIVITFVRETLPEGSDDAFSEREVTTFNANRASEERFAPY